MAYCEVADLIIGDIRTSARLDPQKYVNDAADEIDSKIGFAYVTPIYVTSGTTVPRPVVLLLKRINSHLASGRLILAATIAGEDQELNAYGRSLVEDSELAIAKIASGELYLDGVIKGEASVGGLRRSVPLFAEGDPESYVDAFYDRVVNPCHRSSFIGGYRGAGG